MEHRKTDPHPKTWFRSERVFRADGSWFFHTREGIAVGPYASQFEAEVDAGMLKSMLKNADPESAVAIIREFMVDGNKTCSLNASEFTDYVVDEGYDALGSNGS